MSSLYNTGTNAVVRVPAAATDQAVERSSSAALHLRNLVHLVLLAGESTPDHAALSEIFRWQD